MSPQDTRSMLTPVQAIRSATSSPASMPTRTVSLKEESVPYMELPQPALLSFANFKSCELEDEQAKLTSALQNLSSRVDHLLAFGTEADASDDSATQNACIVSLRTRLPLILRQTKQMIEGPDEESRQLRSTLALFRAIQYVDRIQEGMDPEYTESLDQQLQTVLSGLDIDSLPEDFKKNLSFHVSMWVPSVLCFELPLGESARTSLQGDCSQQQLPIHVEVEPVVEFRADDRASVSYAHYAARACQVTIEKVKHTARDFGPAMGIIGEATIRVRVTPRDGSGAPHQIQMWAKDKEVIQSLCIKEARALQLNAYPPKSKANVDLYTSYVYGDTAVTVTMVIKTCVTGSSEPPNLHVELFMAPPQTII